MKILVSFLLGLVVGAAAVYVMDRPREVQRVGTETGEVVSGEARELATDLKEGTKAAARGLEAEAEDAMISGKIKARFAQDETVPALKIDVDTTEGVVTLSGKVESQVQADRAVQVAKSVEGVRDVRSTLLVAGTPAPR